MSNNQIDFENMNTPMKHCDAEGLNYQHREQYEAWTQTVRYRDSVKNWLEFGKDMGVVGFPLWLLFTPSALSLYVSIHIWIHITDDPSVFP